MSGYTKHLGTFVIVATVFLWIWLLMPKAQHFPKVYPIQFRAISQEEKHTPPSLSQQLRPVLACELDVTNKWYNASLELDPKSAKAVKALGEQNSSLFNIERTIAHRRLEESYCREYAECQKLEAHDSLVSLIGLSFHSCLDNEAHEYLSNK